MMLKQRLAAFLLIVDATLSYPYGNSYASSNAGANSYAYSNAGLDYNQQFGQSPNAPQSGNVNGDFTPLRKTFALNPPQSVINSAGSSNSGSSESPLCRMPNVQFGEIIRTRPNRPAGINPNVKPLAYKESVYFPIYKTVNLPKCFVRFTETVAGNLCWFQRRRTESLEVCLTLCLGAESVFGIRCSSVTFSPATQRCRLFELNLRDPDAEPRMQYGTDYYETTNCPGCAVDDLNQLLAHMKKSLAAPLPTAGTPLPKGQTAPPTTTAAPTTATSVTTPSPYFDVDEQYTTLSTDPYDCSAAPTPGPNITANVTNDGTEIENPTDNTGAVPIVTQPIPVVPQPIPIVTQPIPGVVPVATNPDNTPAGAEGGVDAGAGAVQAKDLKDQFDPVASANDFANNPLLRVLQNIQIGRSLRSNSTFRGDHPSTKALLAKKNSTATVIVASITAASDTQTTNVSNGDNNNNNEETPEAPLTTGDPSQFNWWRLLF